MMAVRTDGLICCNCPGKHVFQPIKHASIPGQVTRTQTKFATILDWNQTIKPKRIASVGTFDDLTFEDHCSGQLISGLTMANNLQVLVSCILIRTI